MVITNIHGYKLALADISSEKELYFAGGAALILLLM